MRKQLTLDARHRTATIGRMATWTVYRVCYERHDARGEAKTFRFTRETRDLGEILAKARSLHYVKRAWIESKPNGDWTPVIGDVPDLAPSSVE